MSGRRWLLVAGICVAGGLAWAVIIAGFYAAPDANDNADIRGDGTIRTPISIATPISTAPLARAAPDDCSPGDAGQAVTATKEVLDTYDPDIRRGLTEPLDEVVGDFQGARRAILAADFPSCAHDLRDDLASSYEETIAGLLALDADVAADHLDEANIHLVSASGRIRELNAIITR